MDKIEILTVDDEQEMLVSYQKILDKAGYAVATAGSGEEALHKLDGQNSFVLVVTDLKMPGMDGMELLKILNADHPHLPVIMVTGQGTLEKGIEAVKKGAFDFIEKPFSSRKLLASIEEALRQISPDRSEGEETNGFSGMVGRSPAMKSVFSLIKKVAYGNASVLITGATGVGKEMVARSIHKHSVRRNQPLIPINCGALPESLFESELFGYEKGAFTGAFQAKPGLVELARGGTLFLDEICEMPESLQVKLLRMVEDRKIRRIGGKSEIPVDIRLLSATNRDVQEAVAGGRLREDLYFRINTINIHVPPLIERVEDIPLLINHFLRELNRKYNRQIIGFSPEALGLMQQYPWPGNVRELQNRVERTYYLATPPTITLNDLPAELLQMKPDRGEGDWESLTYKEAKDIVVEDFERRYLSFQLKKHGWNVSRTAENCGIDRRTIHRLINKFDMKKSDRDFGEN